MISYDVGYWGLTCMCQRKGSVFPKALVWALPCAIAAALLHAQLHDRRDEVQRYVGIGTAATTVFGGFNFILGFLVVFRSQQAYNRWWEGGTLLQQLRGEWFNSFSCLVAFSNNAPEKREDVAKFQQQLVRLFSLLYGCALRQVSHMKHNNFELINLEGFDEDSLSFLETCPDKCEVALQWIQRLIVESNEKEMLKIAPPILSRVFNELGNGIVNLNNARKIKDFLIPFPLAQMIMVMLLFHTAFTPLVCAATVETTTWAAMLTFVVVFSYWSVLYIALELEMPFGDDPNDLPLREMAVDLNMSLCKMLEPYASRVPTYTYNPGQDDLGRVNVDLDKDLACHAAPRLYEAAHCPQIEPRKSMDMLQPWVKTLTTSLSPAGRPANDSRFCNRSTTQVDLAVVGSSSLDRKKTHPDEVFASCSELPVTIQGSINTLDGPRTGASSHPTSDMSFADFDDIEHQAPQVEKGQLPSPPCSEPQTQRQPSFTKSFLADPQQQACPDDQRRQGAVLWQLDSHMQNVEIATLEGHANANLRRSPTLAHPEDLQRNMQQRNASMPSQLS